ncbi:hypothetical protein Q8A67_000074 [Cirrhinus molitorella]|uniref:Fibronectin type-III domain-containing protein n=1 Tax=Cirrhinus molitorella TaxID=172907 RepID=A0AA88TZV1_9TELE|nr:hypothetical protein Q8A67_000074 [Cirrhinus molitorella]
MESFVVAGVVHFLKGGDFSDTSPKCSSIKSLLQQLSPFSIFRKETQLFWIQFQPETFSISVKGSADYLYDKKKSKNQSRVTLQYRTTTRFEQLTMEHLGAGNVKHNNIFQEGSATHVVTALLYGAQAFFIFDREVSSSESHQDIHGDLHATIKKIPTISIEGQASLKELDEDKFSCTFHGDFALENNPVTYVDVIKVYSELPKLLGEKGENAVPMTVWLYPLKKLDSTAAQLVREISVSLVRRAQQIMDGLDDCDIQCQDLMRDNVTIQFPDIEAKLRKFKDLCSEYKVTFQKHLCRLLPTIRGGGKEEQELSDFLNRKGRSPFQGFLLTKYLSEREQEMNVVESYLDIMKEVQVLSSSTDLDKLILKASNVIVFALSSLKENDPYLSELENYLNEQSCNLGEQLSYDQNSTEKANKWFSSRDVTALTRETIQAFLDFKEVNDGRKNIEFCIASIPDELSTASSIHVYERGRLVSSQYEFPSKPPIPVFLSAEHDCICLQIKPPDRGASFVESYCISYQSADSSEWRMVNTNGVSDQITVKPLQPHKEYCFTCKAVCCPGVSLTSDTTSYFRTRPCAPPGAPTVKQVESESVTVVWDVPSSVGEDILVTDYVLELRECTKDQENEMPWMSVKSAYKECTVQGLNADTIYTLRVLANCGNNGASLARLSANQRYIFDSILSIFGKDIAENIIFLVTFADGKEVPVLEAIKAADLPCQKNKMGQPTHFKFNNTAVYADKKVEEPPTADDDSDDDDDDSSMKLCEIVWTSTFKQMKAFFKALGTIESKDLTLTKNVLEERERLEKAMADLIPQISAGLSKLNEIKTFRQCLENESELLKQNENFEKEVDVVKAKRIPVERFTLNCNICFFTCHSTCFLPADDPVSACAVMNDAGHCVVCPQACHHTAHLKEKVMWTYETIKEKKTIEELKKNFMKASGKFMDTKQILDALEKEFCELEEKLKQVIQMSSDCLRQLDKIALKPKSFSAAEYFEMLIKTEKEEQSTGYEDRIYELEKLKKETLLLEKIEKGDNLLKQ